MELIKDELEGWKCTGKKGPEKIVSAASARKSRWKQSIAADKLSVGLEFSTFRVIAEEMAGNLRPPLQPEKPLYRLGRTRNLAESSRR